MNATAQPRPCTACKRLHISVTPALCPECEKDSEFYKATRKKGDPRQFLPYPELLEQWRRRRADCREWKKAATAAADRWAALSGVDLVNRYLLAALTALSADLDPVLALAAELEAARAELATVTESRDHWQRQASIGTAAFDARVDGIIQGLSGRGIPPEQWRRLVQLAHPDRHENSTAAQEATRWLLENRP